MIQVGGDNTVGINANSPVIIFIFMEENAPGNLYCSYLCPFGALQEGAAKLFPKKCRPEPKRSSGLAWLR